MTSPIRRLGVLGDVHGEHGRLAAALDWLADQNLDTVICTGDLADGPGSIDRCCDMLRAAGVLTVAGNHDRWMLSGRVRHVADAHRLEDVDPRSAAFLRELPRTRRLDTVAGPLLLCHGIGRNDLAKVWPGTRGDASIRRSPELDAILEDGEYRFIVHGHLHYRVLIDFEQLLLMNAGTLKGEGAGVCIVDFDAGQIGAFAFDDGLDLRRRSEMPLLPGSERRIWRDTGDFNGRWQPALF